MDLESATLRLRVLADVSHAFAVVATSYRALLQTIATTVADRVGDGCLVTLVAADGSLANAATAHRDPARAPDYEAYRSRAGDTAEWSLSARVVRTGELQHVPVIDPAAIAARVPEPMKELVERLEVRSLVIVPIRARGAILGTLSLFRSTPDLPYNANDITLVEDIADRAGLAIDAARAYDELEQRVRERTEQLETSNRRLSEALKEREVLLQEVHHRVKNNLQMISSLINMQLRTVPAGAAHDALDDCRTRVHAIALIHEQLYGAKSYARVGFAAYARSLADNVFLTAAGTRRDIALDLDIDDVELELDQAIPCGLVLNELISNALKHAFVDRAGGRIRVDMKRADARVRLAVRDDGVGMPGDFAIANASSLGLQLVHALAEQLDGALSFATEHGTRVELVFAAR